MLKLYTIGTLSALFIGVVTGLIAVFWKNKKRTKAISGISLVFVLCFAYHTIAACGMGSTAFHPLTLSIILPFAYGFGEGNHAFVIALLAQATIAGIIGSATFVIIRRIYEKGPYK
jgi:ABC-type dipeptide/oligopeptide/nickel transport system permease component